MGTRKWLLALQPWLPAALGDPVDVRHRVRRDGASGGVLPAGGSGALHRRAARRLMHPGPRPAAPRAVDLHCCLRRRPGGLFHRPQGRARHFRQARFQVFRQEDVGKAHAFLERQGGLAVVPARFGPFMRSLVPVIAGPARVRYRAFALHGAWRPCCGALEPPGSASAWASMTGSAGTSRSIASPLCSFPPSPSALNCRRAGAAGPVRGQGRPGRGSRGTSSHRRGIPRLPNR